MPARPVTINEEQGLFVIRTGDYTSCLGFDVVNERIARYANELAGRGRLPAEYIDNPPEPERGTMESYDMLEALTRSLKIAVEEQNDRAVADLSPQLLGLEGWRVEVVDRAGDKPRRFIVGKSTGWLPIHLEIARVNSSGGMAANLEYHSVRPIEKVR